jgi:hypothetical protein
MIHTTNGLKIISTQEVRAQHEGTYKGHWFKPSSKRFFKSRWSDTAYLIESLNVALFVSSEQHEGHRISDGSYYKEPRTYTIRAVNMKTGSFLCDVSYNADGTSQKIDLLQFERFTTSRQATQAIFKANWPEMLRGFVE